MRILTAVGLLFLTFVTGCAQPADPKRMTVTILPSEGPFPAALSSAICVRSVTGGEPTNPLWVAKVDNAEFKTALTDSLRERGLLARPEGCRFQLDVNLLGLSQPVFGLAFTVTTHVNYKLLGSASEPVLLETISAPYTAEMSEHLVAVIRLARANEGSIRNNITEFLTRLRALRLG